MAWDVGETGATAKITRRAAERLRAGHLWVYRSDVERLGAGTEGPPGISPTVAPGALVSVIDGRGIPLGSALYSEASEIALRVVSGQAGLGRAGDLGGGGRAEYLGEVRERVLAALRLRETLAAEAFSQNAGTNACRLLFAEADAVPDVET